MARALWSGSLSFGLVNVPVQIVSAVRDLDLHFHQLHAKDKVRIEQRRFCSEEDVEVGIEEVAHSYDLDGKQVIVTDEELGSVQPRKTRTIDIETFVPADELDPIHFDHPYFLVPAGDSEGTLRAYRLLVETMGRTDRAALGRFVMRTKECAGRDAREQGDGGQRPQPPEPGGALRARPAGGHQGPHQDVEEGAGGGALRSRVASLTRRGVAAAPARRRCEASLPGRRPRRSSARRSSPPLRGLALVHRHVLDTLGRICAGT
jgi:Ku70/Ku80 beta-barrel domain